MYCVKRCITILLLLSGIWAEKIKLKDGGVIRGQIVSETANELVIANEYGNITIEKKNIARRVREKSDVPSFRNSTYSLKKRSWTKYAFFGTVATGIVTTAILADPGFALISALSFTGVGLTFGALDFFRYGRVAKKIRRRWTSFQDIKPLIHGFPLDSLVGASYSEVNEFNLSLAYNFSI